MDLKWKVLDFLVIALSAKMARSLLYFWTDWLAWNSTLLLKYEQDGNGHASGSRHVKTQTFVRPVRF